MSSDKTILVVDDDPVTLTLVQKVLKEKGYQTITAKNGADAIKKVSDKKPDLMILDIMMPEVNGYDVCNAIKFDDRHKTLPIIILTSRQQELDSRIGSMMGIDYLNKPLNRELLLEKIEAALS